MKQERNFRLVCHSCSHRYPVNAACKPDCCPTPKLHVHDVNRPCSMCGDAWIIETEEWVVW